MGFTRHGTIAANVMVLATGKTITMGLNELADSEISEDLSRHELQALYRKLYGDNQQKPPTSSAIAMNDPGTPT